MAKNASKLKSRSISDEYSNRGGYQETYTHLFKMDLVKQIDQLSPLLAIALRHSTFKMNAEDNLKIAIWPKNGFDYEDITRKREVISRQAREIDEDITFSFVMAKV